MDDSIMDEPAVPARPQTDRRRLDRRIAIGAAATLAVVAAIGALSGAGQVTWSDAAQAAPIARARPRLVVDPKVYLAEANIVDDGVVHAPATTETARGVVQSTEQAVIASRMTAVVLSMPLDAGQHFARGQALATFDCAQLHAQLTAAQAAAAAYRKTYDTNVELDQFKAIGTNEVAVSKANLGKAVAEAQVYQAGTADCTIRAPFSGTVVEKIGHAHDVAASGQPLMKIQGSGSLEVELIVPSSWMTWLKPGARFDYAIDETGTRVEGRIVRFGAAVDPVSKTIRVTGTLKPAATILPGMSGTATFVRESEHGVQA